MKLSVGQHWLTTQKTRLVSDDIALTIKLTKRIENGFQIDVIIYDGRWFSSYHDKFIN